MPRLVPPVRTARTARPVRIHSAMPAGGGFAPFGPEQLRQMVENWQRYQSRPNPAFPTPQATYIPDADVSIGHDHDQAFARSLLGRTDLPSCGRPVRVWMDGADVFAELDGIPEPVAAMANAGMFREVSAEIYPNFRTPDGKYVGPVLRRIALLGSAQPRQKGLGGLSPLVYSFAEPGRPGRQSQQVAILFSESPFMDKAQALQILQAAGIDTSGFTDAPDALVIAFATFVQQQANAPAATMGTGQMAPATQFAEVIGRQVSAALAATVLPAMTQMNQRFGTILQQAERQECETFAESNREKLFPFETDANSDKYIVTRLMGLPVAARKSEMAAISSRPAVAKFSERMGSTGTTVVMPDPAQRNAPVTDDRTRHLLSLTAGGRGILARKSAK